MFFPILCSSCACARVSFAWSYLSVLGSVRSRIDWNKKIVKKRDGCWMDFLPSHAYCIAMVVDLDDMVRLVGQLDN